MRSLDKIPLVFFLTAVGPEEGALSNRLKLPSPHNQELLKLFQLSASLEQQ